DHQVLLVGGPWKSLVTLGDTSSPRRLAPTLTSGAGSVTRNPAPTFSERTAGVAGSGRGSMRDGPHERGARVATEQRKLRRRGRRPAPSNTIIDHPIRCAERRAPCACFS